MMQAIGRRYVGGFNARYCRTGTLWEGRFKAALVDSDRYLLTCYLNLELNPVRARMVVHPCEYGWSSYHCNASGADEARITRIPATWPWVPTQRSAGKRTACCLTRHCRQRKPTRYVRIRTSNAPSAALASSRRSKP